MHKLQILISICLNSNYKQQILKYFCLIISIKHYLCAIKTIKYEQ